MSRPIRHCIPGGLVEVTTRTTGARFLLAPTEELREIVLGVLGRALARYPVILHAFIFMSNHYELLLTTPDSLVLSQFMAYFNSNTAREAGRLFGWYEGLWGRRYRAIPVLDEESQVRRLHYLLSNGCKEGLVASPRDWPGATCLPGLLEGRVLQGKWFDRTAACRARRRGANSGKDDFTTIYEIPLAPLPCWAHLPIEQQRRRCAELVSIIEAETLEANRVASRDPIGAASLQMVDPHSKPLESSHTPAPICHAASRERYLAYRASYAEFVARFRQSAESLARGAKRVQFPEYCFPPAMPYVAAAPVSSPRHRCRTGGLAVEHLGTSGTVGPPPSHGATLHSSDALPVLS